MNAYQNTVSIKSHRGAISCLTLDAETTRLILPEDEYDFVGPLPYDFQPLTFSCVATLNNTVDSSEKSDSRIWFTQADVTVHFLHGDSTESELLAAACSARVAMTPQTCIQLVRYLAHLILSEDVSLFTFNGVSFDLRILANQLPPGASTEREACRKMALKCIDPCLHMWCERGFPVGLNSMLKGWDMPEKLEHGSDAPSLWASPCEYSKVRVLRYCVDDVKCTYNLIVKICERNEVRWISNRSGKVCCHKLQMCGLYTAMQAVLLPFPNTEWAIPNANENENKRLPHREKALGWLLDPGLKSVGR
jgi:hypothetical protein